MNATTLYQMTLDSPWHAWGALVLLCVTCIAVAEGLGPFVVRTTVNNYPAKAPREQDPTKQS